jgi:hypothetical protein
LQEGLQLSVLLEKVRKAGLRAEHVAFSLMKRRIQSLMGRGHLSYEYTVVGDSSRMHEEEIDDDLIIERLGKCHTDIHGPSTQAGTGTDYCVGPWDYSTWAARHQMRVKHKAYRGLVLD